METQILIIDDDELDRMSYMRQLLGLKSYNFQFIEACTAQEGLRLCESKKPDCLIIDYDMPGINGVELLDLLKSNSLLDELGIVFLTGQGDERIAVEAMKHGAHDYISKSAITPDRLNRAIGDAMAQSRLYQEVQEKNRQIELLAYRDPLTGMLNQMAFETAVNSALSSAKRHGHNLALLFIDLDHFKNVNDTLGHDIGDLLLKEVCVRIESCLRQEDIIARMGGDEFAIALTELRHEDDAGIVAQKIIDVLVEKFVLNGKEAHIGASIGIGTFPDSENTFMGLLKHSDIAMYRAKELGRNNYQYFSADLHQQHIEDMEIEHALSFAIERDELYIEYQPQYDLVSKKMVGIEALLRWQHPELGYIPPDKIFNIAEESGQCSFIGRWVVETVCRECSDIVSNYPAPISISINATSRQLSSEKFIAVFKDSIKKYKIKAKQIEIEISESAITDDIQKTKSYLDSLRSLGVNLAIDDFGTGYSSLSQLKNYLPITTLKIDKSFINNATTNDDDAMLIKSIIDIAKNLGLRVIAEGVEMNEQTQLLIQCGCTLAQGYYLAKPMRAEDIKKLPK